MSITAETLDQTNGNAARERGETVRRRILDAAIGILGSEGLDALTTAAVCKAASITKPSLYWHFGSKEGLLVAIVKDVGRRDYRAFREVDVAGLGWEAAFTAYMDVLRRLVVHETPNNWLILAAILEGREAAPEIVDLVRDIRIRQVEYQASDIENRWGLKGNHRLIAHMWLSFASYVSLLYRDTQDKALVDDALDAFYRAFFLIAAATGESDSRSQDMAALLSDIGYAPVGRDR